MQLLFLYNLTFRAEASLRYPSAPLLREPALPLTSCLRHEATQASLSAVGFSLVDSCNTPRGLLSPGVWQVVPRAASYP